MFVCKQEDEFTFEKPRWVAHLSNGENILQDDERPGIEPKQSWLRLKDYCRQNMVDVVNLTLQFRSHTEIPLPANADAYFFCNRVVTMLNSDIVIGFHLIGYLKDKILRVQHWKVPEYVLVEEDFDRVINDNEYYLIWRNDARMA